MEKITEDYAEEGVSEDEDFFRVWLDKRFTKNLDSEVGKEKRLKIMGEHKSISKETLAEDHIKWVKEAMQRLESLVEDQAQRKKILNACGCLLTGPIFKQLNEKYEETKDIDEVLKLNHEIIVHLHERAHKEGFWNVDTQTLEEVRRNPLIEAGVRKGNKILIRKVPGSSTEYNLAENEGEKRYRYCHCPWVRESIKLGINVSPTFCECSGGFYKKFWERIISKPVEVEMVKSILNGDHACEFVLHLPLNM